MKRKIITVFAAAITAVSTVGLAGEAEHSKKCAGEAEVCVRQMAEKLKQRGWIGIEMADGEGRKVVTRVVPGSPAEASGLRAGDGIVAINGASLADGDEKAWAEVKKVMTPGAEVSLTVDRAGSQSVVPVTLAELPRELLAQWIGQHMLEGHSTPDSTAEGSQ